MGKNYKLCFYALAFAIMATSLDSSAFKVHEVKRSETLWGIAYKYNVSAEDIVAANPNAKNGLKTGMKLNIPEKSDLESLRKEEIANTEPEATNIGEAAPAKSVSETTAETIATPASGYDPTPIAQEADESIEIVETHPAAIAHEGVYKSKFGDTFKGISNKTGVSVETLLSLNPFIDPENVPEGTSIRLSADAPYIVTTQTQNLVDSVLLRIPSALVSQEAARLAENEKTIVVMLPFDLEGDVISRQSLLATDFYKGFLIAAKQAADEGNLPFKIIAIDTQTDPEELDKDLSNLANMKVNVIIPPDDEQQLDKIEKFALENDIMVLNALSIKDEGYIEYPNVVQCNISQKLMYDKAIAALLNDFSAYTPVILDLSGGKDEKLSFIDELNKQYVAKGRNVITLPFRNELTAGDLSKLPQGGKYIFIPKSGSTEVFNKVSDALLNLIEENILNDDYKVFGYPDWIAFRGEHEDILHRMGAYIYSRFYMNPQNTETASLSNDFIKWYGYQMEDVFPSQGILGYDTGALLFGKLKLRNVTNDIDRFDGGIHQGLQSTFNFIRDNSGTDDESEGLINDALYIIEFLPGESVYVKSI